MRNLLAICALCIIGIIANGQQLPGRTGSPAFLKNYDSVRKFSNHLAAVNKNGKWGFINENGQEVIAARYDAVTDFVNGQSLACLHDNCNYINTSGSILPLKNMPVRQQVNKVIPTTNTANLNNRTANITSVPCPTNIDFENGNFSNWKTNIGDVYATSSGTVISLPSGTWLNNINTPNRQELQDRTSNVTPIDYYGGFPVNPPGGGGRYSLKLGSDDDDLPSCTCPNARAEAVRYQILVPQAPLSNDFSITFSYAVVLENPLSAVNLHLDKEQPRFKITMYDTSPGGDTISCANFTFVASGPLPGFDTSIHQKRTDAIVKYKAWSSVYVNLSKYPGKTINLDFITGDCTKGGHFGYAYVDVMECGIGATAVYKCSPSVTNLSGPPGFQSYQWYDYTYSTLIGTGQNVNVTPSPPLGTKYWVIATPYANTGCPTCDCRDTVGVEVNAIYPIADAGPPKSFCIGSSTQIGTNASPGLLYQWLPATGLSNASIANPLAGPAQNTQYVLSVTDQNTGCSTTDTTDVYVNPKPTINFTPSTFAACITGNNFDFINSSTLSNGTMGYLWRFGDGATANSLNASHSYSAPGTYTVKLIGTTNNSCKDSMSKDVTVHPKPAAAFNINIPGQCITGNNFLFTNASNIASGSFNSFWDFGDGFTSNAANASHSYSIPGTYLVKLVVTSNNGCPDSLVKTIVVDPVPVANFTITNAVQCLNNNSFSFTNSSSIATGTINYLWNFGDGNTSPAINPSHSYLASGNYPVSLTVTSQNGCSANISKPVTVDPKPVTAFAINNGNQCITGNSFSFTNNSTIATGSFSYLWDFGDGNTSINLNPSHSYASAGVYTVKLVLTSNKGCKDSLSQTVNVYPKPAAGFTINSSGQCINTNNFLFANTSTISSGTISYNWNFGDGGFSIQNSPAHAYNLPGNYPVKLIVTSLFGCMDSVSHPVTLFPKPDPLWASTNSQQCLVGNNFSFINSSSISSGSQLPFWNFGDGTTSTLLNPSHSYVQAGTYSIKLVLLSDKGCRDSLTKPVTVNPNPVVSVTTNKNLTLCRGNSVQLNATGAQAYSWNPVQFLSCTNCANPIASPLNGTIKYTVTGTNSFGCPAEDSVNIMVVQPFQIQSNSGEICVGQSVNLLASGAQSFSWSPATDLSSTTIPNPVSKPSATITYTVVGYDNYNCFTDTAYSTVLVHPNPVINLGPDLVLSSGTSQTLTYTLQNGPIATWLWTPSTLLSCTNCPVPVATIKSDVAYSVYVTNIYGCKGEDNIIIKAFCQNTQVFIPNVFTPDGDGVNDLLTIQAKGITKIKSFRIFNRWGELLFEKLNFAPNDPAYSWDGKIRGQVGPPDVFVYTAEVLCENGVVFMYKGNVSILK